VSANFTTSALGNAFERKTQAETVVEGRLRRFLLCSGGIARQKASSFRLTASPIRAAGLKRVRMSKAPVVMLSRLAEDCNAS
jgi:hypothetical protein